MKEGKEEKFELANKIHYVGVDDHKNQLFEGLWPIPNGISYNAYLINDDKKALIEGGVKEEFTREFLMHLQQYIDLNQLDYIVINHMEPDHTGSLPHLYKLAKKAKIIVTNLGKRMLSDFYKINDAERIMTVKDGDKIELGENTLEFYTTPGVHWPETMMTYEKTNKILFTGDAFGSFGALNGRLYDYEWEKQELLEESKRYFVNIIGKYTSPTLNAIKKVSNLEIKVIAPSHGPVWVKEPEVIINHYKQLAEGKIRKWKVTIVYATMYGFNEELVRELSRKLVSKNFKVKVLNAVNTHVSYILSEVWDSEFVVIGTPTYDAGAFPTIEYAVHLIERKFIKNKKYAIIGTSGWSGKGYKGIQEKLEKLNWQLIEPIVETKGAMSKENLKQLNELVEQMQISISS